MDSTIRFVYELLWREKLREASGTGFQALFDQVMSLRHGTDFRKVRPYGNQGDWACDGILTSQRMLFQAYAPFEMTAAAAIDKIDHDLERAVEKWGAHFDKWVFVHNDSRGLPPQVVEHLLAKNRHRGKSILSWEPATLTSVVFGIPESELVSLLGPPVSASALRGCTLVEVKAVVDHIERTDPDPLAPVESVPPGKASHNQLSEGTKRLLEIGYQKAALVSKYFRGHPDATVRDRIASALNQKYLSLKSAGLPPDEVFGGLWSFTAGGVQHHQATKIGAELAVLARFFESCDIFERPPAQGRSGA